MVERLHRLYMRMLRALQDMRRLPEPIKAAIRAMVGTATDCS
jgi:hypothetical protein